MTIEEEIARTPSQPSESLFWRNMLELAQKTLRIAQQQEREWRFAGEHGFDIDALPGGDTKAYKTPRDPADIDLIVVHVTAVSGGFGVQKYGEQGWQHWLTRVKNTRALYARGKQVGEDWAEATRIYGPLLPEAIADQLFRAEILFDDPLSVAKRVAKWSRYRFTPYQEIGSPFSGDVIDNRRCTQRSWASGAGGNDGVAYASDCDQDEVLDDFGIETCRAGLRRLHGRLIAARVAKHGSLAEIPTIRVAPHRAFEYPGRAKDDGAFQWRHVVLPVCESTPGLVPAYDLFTKKGRPIPSSWDASAHFDERGRRVRP